MNAPEWTALLIAVAVGVAFWAVIELLMRCPGVCRIRRTVLRSDPAIRNRGNDRQPERQD